MQTGHSIEKEYSTSSRTTARIVAWVWRRLGYKTEFKYRFSSTGGFVKTFYEVLGIKLIYKEGSK